MPKKFTLSAPQINVSREVYDPLKAETLLVIHKNHQTQFPSTFTD